jgi:DNA-binding CsgD family transcriptional regulator
MPGREQLRPVERCVLRLAAAGVDDEEIARRFKRSAAWVALVRRLASIERRDVGGTGAGAPAHGLRPLERRLLRWREHGISPEELGDRFRRSPEFLARVEGYANLKLATR